MTAKKKDEPPETTVAEAVADLAADLDIEREVELLVTDGAGTVVDVVPVPPPVIVPPWDEGAWHGIPNYACRDCQFSTTNKDHIVAHVVAGHARAALPDDIDITTHS